MKCMPCSTTLQLQRNPRNPSMYLLSNWTRHVLPAMWHWLHYDPSNNAAFCHTCITGLLRHKMKATSVEPAFVSTYYIIIGYRVKI